MKKVKTQKMKLDDYLKQLGHTSRFDKGPVNLANAYADCLPETVDTTGLERDLNYMSRDAVSAVELRKYLDIIGDYNDFSPERVTSEIISTFGENARIFIAREGSPCLYIKPLKQVWFGRRAETAISCDEFSFDADLGLFRVWWD